MRKCPNDVEVATPPGSNQLKQRRDVLGCGGAIGRRRGGRGRVNLQPKFGNNIAGPKHPISLSTTPHGESRAA